MMSAETKSPRKVMYVREDDGENSLRMGNSI